MTTYEAYMRGRPAPRRIIVLEPTEDKPKRRPVDTSFVTVRARDGRTGTVKEYNVRKGTPVKEVLGAVARDQGRTDIHARVTTLDEPPGPPEAGPPPVPDCAGCSWNSALMCGLYLDVPPMDDAGHFESFEEAGN